MLAAVDAVRRGREFVSKGLLGQTFTNRAEKQVADRLRHDEDLRPLGSRTSHFSRGHVVNFYADDTSFRTGFALFIEAAMEAGGVVIVIATESHRKSIFQRLQAQGADVAAAIAQSRYILLDVAETLKTFMLNDEPDPDRFQRTVGELFALTAKGVNGERRSIAACGEIAPTLWAQDDGDAAIRVEHLWDNLSKAYDVKTLCGYAFCA